MKRNISRMGRKCLLALFCLAFFPGARAWADRGPGNDCLSAPPQLEDHVPDNVLSLARMPVMRENDPGIELASISRHQIEKMGHHRVLVAMHLGEKPDLCPDPLSASPVAGTGTIRGISGYSAGLSGLGAVSFENEKVAEEPEDWSKEDTGEQTIADPLEPINRLFFAFNDRLYFWVLKPVAIGYKYVVPEPFRVGIRNMFTNLAMPVRAVNCLLQGKFRGFGREVLRFLVNTTVGFLGFVDAAEIGMHLEAKDEDFGQTLGFFGAGPGIFINWPVLGPSSLRDTLGMAGDFFVDPLNYLVTGRGENIAARGVDRVNRTSLSIGDYESLKKSALDPYVAVRNAYFQYRRAKIKK